MILVFPKPEVDSKEYFLKLNSSFCLSGLEHSDRNRLAGVYAILQKDVCFYVGQSKNLASRLATHLTGKIDESYLRDYIEEQNQVMEYMLTTKGSLQ